MHSYEEDIEEYEPEAYGDWLGEHKEDEIIERQRGEHNGADN